MAAKQSSLESAIEDFKKGKFVIVVDDEHRENEGDLAIAAEDITPSKINFILKHARGMMCVPMRSMLIETWPPKKASPR